MSIIFLVATGEPLVVMEPGLRPTMTGLSMRMVEDWSKNPVHHTMLLIDLAMMMTAVTTREPTSLVSTTNGTLMRRR